MDIAEVRMLDVARPDAIEVEVSEDGTTMWVHVNGVTLLRASHIGRLFITDHRNQELAARRETRFNSITSPKKSLNANVASVTARQARTRFQVRDRNRDEGSTHDHTAR